MMINWEIENEDCACDKIWGFHIARFPNEIFILSGKLCSTSRHQIMLDAKLHAETQLALRIAGGREDLYLPE